MGHSREAVSCRSRTGGQGIPGAADNVQIDVVAEGGGLTELRLDAYGFTGFGNFNARKKRFTLLHFGAGCQFAPNSVCHKEAFRFAKAELFVKFSAR